MTASRLDVGDTMRNDRLALGCALPRRHLESIQHGTMRYTYKGVPTYKDPFDLALYQLLLWEKKPRTLIEIGSKWGGSALWFADVLRSFDIDYQIHSIDLQPLVQQAIPGVTFHRGDGRDLSGTLSPDLMVSLPRPLMIIEDADHRRATTLAVLHFFDRWLRAGEYIIIEDGIVEDLFDGDRIAGLEGGPRLAIAVLARARPGLRDRHPSLRLFWRQCDLERERLSPSRRLSHTGSTDAHAPVIARKHAAMLSPVHRWRPARTACRNDRAGFGRCRCQW